MTIQELENEIRNAHAKGATKEEMQKLESFYMETLKNQSQFKPKTEVGFFKGMVQEVAKPFLKVASSAANIVGAPIAAIAGKTEEYNKQIQEGMDYGFFGKVSPIGTQFTEEGLTTGQKIGRTAADLGGTMAEIASYGLAPLKGIKGMGFFETAIKAGWKPSLAFGTGKALQAGGEGKGATDIALAGAGGYLGSSLGFAIAGKGAQMIGNWGAKALQSQAVKATGETIKNIAEKIWTAMPESFRQKGFQMADALLNASTRRTIRALESEYAQAHKNAVGAWIDLTVSNVDNPDLVLGEYQRALSSEIGGMFRKSATLYDDFKAANPISESAADWNLTNQAIGKIPPKSNLSYFFMGLKKSLERPTSPRMVLSTYEQLMSEVQKASTNEEKVAIRNIAQSLYSDMRNILQTKDKSLLNKWDEAYQAWKSATDIYESNPLNKLKSSGQVDTIVDEMVNKTMTRNEQQVIYEAMKNNPEPVRNLFISSLLRKAKGMSPEEGSKLIRNFLDSWDFKLPNGKTDNGFLNPNQAKYLDDLASYMEENFNEFTNGMRKTVGIQDETTIQLAEQKAKLEISKLIDKGDLEGIAENWAKISGTENFTGALKLLSPDERKVVGLSLWRKMFEQDVPLITTNPDGTANFKPFVDAFKTAYAEIQRVGGSKKSGILEQMYTKSQIDDFGKANELLNTYKNIQEVPEGDIESLVHGALSLFYFRMGGKYAGAAARHGGEALAPSKKTFYEAIDKLVEDGILKKNWAMSTSDILRLLELPAGEFGGQITNEIIK